MSETKKGSLGHEAPRPRDIPAAGWIQIGKRAFAEMQADHVSLIAAGVAFYGLLALFPAITAFFAIGGLILSPEEVTAQMQNFSSVMPERAAEIVLTQASEVAGSQDAGLGLAALFGLALALYSASKGVGSLIEGLNIAYDETETRGFIKLKLLTLALTVMLVIGMVAGLSATIVLPSVFSLFNLPPSLEQILGLARWAVLLVMTVIGLSTLYHFGPDRSAPRWSWLLPGAALACVLWLLASIGFAIYAENFGSYNESFGALAGVIVLLMWLWISAFVLLLGAELNSEAEQQTFHDTTVGPDMPMGMRGAVKADTPPPSVD
ncbi:YihY/virulence factor BrkB family protein [Pseudoroseicyclus tamaricis]|uniref:YihY/virulence factor BrkB family protein n=1 Tax=Pseudoroseicyclus tamaricis TaxID=2705421 RepID=A0A6B2K3M3_9RHOB|nr:YihY/virulence factor BrkB family protein [Pseudoroseicyclus tamaricis]NDV02402.1 YihY/virulence factor BrkB family protein [Pseudoroseicyclus tamaricis]